ncbi:YihY/virulence factor BrkB family protein [Nocardioides sp. KR10-350]|uniref:YihY/virulence factor BrkB family protein n=1 Tax=Nocardioides cheoyonin TaxID=3156615 RepID=UPI0032B4E537
MSERSGALDQLLGRGRAKSEATSDEGSDVETPPRSPLGLSKRSWLYVLRKTIREFSGDQCTDLAAALTYYSVLALFPGAIALMSLIGLVGQGEETVNTITDIMRDVGAGSIADTLQPTLNELSKSTTAGLALVLGLLGAAWSASGYVGAFGRAMNRVYGVQEGRPVWKLRPAMLTLTAVTLVLAAIALLAMVLTGPVAKAVGDQIGLGSTAVLIWDIAKWPVLVFVVMLIVALLYWGTPNIRPPRFHWLSVGALVAIITWAVASAGFGAYVANFSSYDRTYGSLAGVIVFLLWLWITNLALLFGAELDAELERGRELQSGIAAEENVQLPPRDTRTIEKAEKKRLKDVEKARKIRLDAAHRLRHLHGRHAHVDDRTGKTPEDPPEKPPGTES